VEDKEIAARAVAFVVNSTRKGIVPLCADIANLLRAKRRYFNPLCFDVSALLLGTFNPLVFIFLIIVTQTAFFSAAFHSSYGIVPVSVVVFFLCYHEIKLCTVTMKYICVMYFVF
jgi:hypothetical protein